MNIVIYARFSSHNQNEQSIEGQLQVCYEYCKRNEYTVLHEYIDRAVSGTTDNRPEFKRMIEDSNKKHFQGVLVYQLDRFARNRYDSALYKAKLKKNGIRVLSARENISDDASGVLMEAVLEGMAEYYSKELSQKIKRGMDINASKCLCTGGNVALGYYVDDNKQFQVDENKAPIVVKIFEKYSSGCTMAEIIRYLNNQNIITSQGNKFNKNSINRILKNKRYIGIYTYNNKEIPGGIPSIVPKNLFYEVQDMIQKKKKAPARAKATTEYILTTKLFCGQCDAAMTGISGTGNNGSKYYYYQCVNNRKKKDCDKKTVKKDYIENLVVEETKNLLTKENINQIAKEVVELCEKESNTDNLKRLQRQLKENEKAITNLTKALADGRVTDIIYNEIEKKQREQKEITKQIVLEEAQHPQLTVQQVKFFMDKFRDGDINDMQYRKALVDTFINKVYLYNDKITILYNLQNSNSDINISKISSPGVTLVEARGVEPLSVNT